MEKVEKSLEYYILAKGITHSARNKGLLLHCTGTEVQELFETLQDRTQMQEKTMLTNIRKPYEHSILILLRS